MKRTFAALAIGAYRLFALSSALSSSCLWGIRLAQTWLILEVAHGDPIALSVTTGLHYLPVLVFGPLGGLLADRFARVRLLIALELVVVAIAGLNGWRVMSSEIAPWEVYVFAAGIGATAAVVAPVRQALAPDLVPAPLLFSAVGLQSATFSAGRMIGPMLMGFAIAGLGLPWSFFAAAGMQLVLVTLPLVLIPADRAPLLDPGDGGRGLGAGVRYVFSRADLRVFLVTMIVVSAMGWNSQFLIAVVASNEFGVDASGLAVATTCFAIGSLFGGLIGARSTGPTPQALLLIAGVFCALTLVTGLMPSYAGFAIVLIPLGASSLTVAVVASLVMISSIPVAMRGRAIAVYQMITTGAIPLGSPVLGWIADSFSARTAYVASAVVMLVALGVAVLWTLLRHGRGYRTWFAPVAE